LNFCTSLITLASTGDGCHDTEFGRAFSLNFCPSLTTLASTGDGCHDTEFGRAGSLNFILKGCLSQSYPSFWSNLLRKLRHSASLRASLFPLGPRAGKQVGRPPSLPAYGAAHQLRSYLSQSYPPLRSNSLPTQLRHSASLRISLFPSGPRAGKQVGRLPSLPAYGAAHQLRRYLSQSYPPFFFGQLINSLPTPLRHLSVGLLGGELPASAFVGALLDCSGRLRYTHPSNFSVPWRTGGPAL